MFKRVMLAVAILASSLFLFSPSHAGASEAAPYSDGTCPQQWTWDGLWHLSNRPGFVYHYVEDNYFAYKLGNECMYTTHAAVDLCNQYGCYFAAWEAWMPYWMSVTQVGDYQFKLVKSYYYNNVTNAGVINMCRNCGASAWKFLMNNVQYGLDGSETERISTIGVTNRTEQLGGSNNYIVIVEPK